MRPPDLFKKVLVMKANAAGYSPCGPDFCAVILRRARAPEVATIIEAIANVRAVARMKISDIGPAPLGCCEAFVIICRTSGHLGSKFFHGRRMALVFAWQITAFPVS
jgi:hypothetical protein